jgi:hypothetical protein
LKRVLAILLLLIHLFNIGGQLVLHEYLVYKTYKFYNKQISENHYDINDLTEIRIPVSMPGVVAGGGYVNINGSVQFKNTGYNYVRIKITSDAIYLLCIPNYASTHLSERNIIDARQIPDIPVPKKDHVPFGKINLASYNYQTTLYKFSVPLETAGKIICDKQLIIPNSSITGPGQPPDSKYLRS